MRGSRSSRAGRNLRSGSITRRGPVVRIKPGGARELRISSAPLLAGEAARSVEALDCPLPLQDAPLLARHFEVISALDRLAALTAKSSIKASTSPSTRVAAISSSTSSRPRESYPGGLCEPARHAYALRPLSYGYSASLIAGSQRQPPVQITPP